MGPVLSRIWEVRRAEWSDVSTSDDGSSEHASYTQAEDEPSNGDRNSISILPDDLLLKYVCTQAMWGGGGGGGGGGDRTLCWDSEAVVYDGGRY